MQYVMVLNDGETYTSLMGCRLVEVPDGVEAEEIEAGIAPDSPNPYTVIRTFTAVPREADYS